MQPHGLLHPHGVGDRLVLDPAQLDGVDPAASCTSISLRGRTRPPTCSAREGGLSRGAIALHHVENRRSIFGPADVLGSHANGEQWLMQAEPIKIAAAATPFVPGVDASLALISRAVASARADVVVLPEGVVGGYLADEELDLDGPEIARLCEI